MTGRTHLRKEAIHANGHGTGAVPNIPSCHHCERLRESLIPRADSADRVGPKRHSPPNGTRGKIRRHTPPAPKGFVLKNAVRNSAVGIFARLVDIPLGDDIMPLPRRVRIETDRDTGGQFFDNLVGWF